MRKKVIKETEVEVEEGQFLDEDGDSITDEFLSIFDKFPINQKDNSLKEKIRKLFYNDISKIDIEYYDSPNYMDFQISTLPGQCSTLIVHDIMVSTYNYMEFIKIINKLAIGLQFSNILITLNNSDKINQTIVDDGFEMFKQGFKNKRTGNKINYYMKYLN